MAQNTHSVYVAQDFKEEVDPQFIPNRPLVKIAAAVSLTHHPGGIRVVIGEALEGLDDPPQVTVQSGACHQVQWLGMEGV